LAAKIRATPAGKSYMFRFIYVSTFGEDEMAMESLGGNLPAGRPIALSSGGRTHVFAIAAGGAMSHWTTSNGIDWQGPADLLRLATNLEASFPCAFGLGNAMHVFAIGHGGLFASGGPLVRWSAPDGVNFLPPVEDGAWPIPGGGNGIAASSPDGSRLDAFAPTSSGLIRYSWSNTLATLGSAPLPDSLNLPRSVPAAVSSGTNIVDVFAVDANGNVLRWHTSNGITWVKSVLPRPAGATAGPLVRTGLVALSPVAGRVELFGVTSDGRLVNWSFDTTTVQAAFLPAPPMTLNESIPAAIIVDGHTEVFAIGQPPNPLVGGPLVRWRRGQGQWSEGRVIDANLAAGGLGATAGTGRVDAFGFNSGTNNSLLHWPAGISVASHEPWGNWANTLQTNVLGQCHPSTEEEVASIVKTAEKMPGARVRAVGSSWSFSDIAETPSFVVQTNQMNGLITHVIDRSVLTDHAPDPKYLIHVEAGIQVEELMRRLDTLTLAPFTMGGSSGQTLAGVISTSVHGSDWDRGPIPNAVRAIRLVGPGGTQHWIEPDQWRITNQAALQARLGTAVQIHYDDDWFDSALVSMGSMGIITSVVFEVTDQYKLKKSCTETKWSQLKPQLLSNSIFADPDYYVMVAIDPAEKGDRTCYVTTHRRTDDAVTPTAARASDPLDAYCNFDAEKALAYLASAPLAAGVLEGVLSVVTATAGAFGIPLPAGATLVVALPILVAALKLAGGGALGDFIGNLFNHSSEATAALVTWMTRDSLKPGATPDVNVAHRIMAPWNYGQCAYRGLAIELAFDAAKGGHVSFLDEASQILDQRRDQGLVLGGYISLRFVGPSRAILSPQQSGRTCMIEITGLRSLNSTAPLLNELEILGTRRHGAIQHWGMFSPPNLVAADLPPAYPRLDTWRRVHREISGAGAIHTFENTFSTRVGLDAATGGVPLVRQTDWRWCRKCLGMAFAGGAAGTCPAGGTHDHSASGNYGFPHNTPSAPGQRNWRWCRKCFGMTFGGSTPAPCPAGGSHDLSTSGEYTILRNGQANWRWCSKCQCLAFGGGAAPGPCAAGGTHDHSRSGNYWLSLAPVVDIELPTRPGMPPRHLRVEQSFNSEEFPGERGWRWCNQCQGFSRDGGRCTGGVPHNHTGSAAYLLACNAPTAPGQAHWRLCKKCQTLSFGGGVCFAGGSHDLVGSADYTVRDSVGQNQWRHCKNCQGLWFSGNGGQGTCPAPAGLHDLGTDDFFV